MESSNAEKLLAKETSTRAYQIKPKQAKGRSGQVTLLPLTPALLLTANLDNLYNAAQEKRRGINWKDSVVGFQANIILNIVNLHNYLINGTYKIIPYKVFTIFEPKKRIIEATAFRDMVVQRSLCNCYIYHALTRHFIYDNCANQKGKGTDFARNRLKCQLHRYWLRNGSNGYCAYIDIKSFFDSIIHDLALEEIRKRATDEFAIEYCRMAMEKHYKEVGIGLGSELSQLIALSFLDGVDHYAKEKLKVKYYVRYMDDSIAIFKTKKEANEYINCIKQELSKRGLLVSSKKTLSFPLKNGINFLGWRYILKPNGRIICKPKKGKIAKARRKLRKMANSLIPLDTIKESLNSIVASLKWGNASKEIKDLENFYKEEIYMKVKTLEDKVKALELQVAILTAIVNPVKDDVQTHKEISEKIGIAYSDSDEKSVIRHTLKTLLNHNGVSLAEFTQWDTYAEEMVKEVKKSEAIKASNK